MKKLKMGVVGCGFAGTGHIDAYKKNENVELIALCDTDEPWLKCAKDIYGVPYIYTDYNEMFENKELDGVSICVPTAYHAPVAIAALNKKLHVLCEKPMTINAKEARAMRDAELRNGAQLMISQNQRFERSVQLLKAMHDEGAFGDVYQVRIGWRRPLGMYPGPYEFRPNGMPYSHNWFNEADKGGGVLRDLGSHLIDLTLHILGFPGFEGAYASSYRKFIPPVPDPQNHVFDSEDLSAGYIKLEGGIGVQYEVSLGSLVYRHDVYTRIYGTKAGAHREGDTVYVVTPTPDGSFKSEENTSFTGMPPRHPSYAFVDAVSNDRPVPVPSDQGIKVIEIIDALYESSGF